MKPVRAAGLYGEVVLPWAQSPDDAGRSIGRDGDAARLLQAEGAMRKRRFEALSPPGRN